MNTIDYVAVAKEINDAHGWKHVNDKGFVTPAAVMATVRGEMPESHPITQEIRMVLRRQIDARKG